MCMCNQASVLIEIYQNKRIKGTGQYVGTKMSITVFLILVKIQEQLKYPKTGNGLNKWWHIHKTGH